MKSRKVALLRLRVRTILTVSSLKELGQVGDHAVVDAFDLGGGKFRSVATSSALTQTMCPRSQNA